VTNIILALGLIIGCGLLALNIREIFYLRSKQRELVRPSWLIVILLRSTATTATVSAIFLALFVVRLAYGVQPWSPWVSVLAILWLLLIPVLRGFEIRRHDRL
jgi:hypothetical protein